MSDAPETIWAWDLHCSLPSKEGDWTNHDWADNPDIGPYIGAVEYTRTDLADKADKAWSKKGDTVILASEIERNDAIVWDRAIEAAKTILIENAPSVPEDGPVTQEGAEFDSAYWYSIKLISALKKTPKPQHVLKTCRENG